MDLCGSTWAVVSEVVSPHLRSQMQFCWLAVYSLSGTSHYPAMKVRGFIDSHLVKAW